MADQGAPEIKPPKIVLGGDVRSGFAWGFVLVLVGVALLLDHMGVTSVAYLWKFWPLLLVFFGVMHIATQAGRGLGLVLIVLGGLLQLNTLGILHLSFRDLWPLAIIAVGILLIWGSLESRGYGPRRPKIDWTKPGAAEEFRGKLREQIAGAYGGANDSGTGPNWLNAVAVFGGCERRFSGHFQGGKAVAVFGGVELDFRDADMDEEAFLEISCVFGGVEIRVPETWAVHSRSMPVFGGLEDKSRHQRTDPTGTNKPKTLIITGAVIFGGVEISN